MITTTDMPSRISNTLNPQGSEPSRSTRRKGVRSPGMKANTFSAQSSLGLSHMLLAVMLGVASATSLASSDSSQVAVQFNPGDRIEGNYKGDGIWYPATYHGPYHGRCTKCGFFVNSDADQCSKCGNKGEGWKTKVEGFDFQIFYDDTPTQKVRIKKEHVRLIVAEGQATYTQRVYPKPNDLQTVFLTLVIRRCDEKVEMREWTGRSRMQGGKPRPPTRVRDLTDYIKEGRIGGRVQFNAEKKTLELYKRKGQLEKAPRHRYIFESDSLVTYFTELLGARVVLPNGITFLDGHEQENDQDSDQPAEIRRRLAMHRLS